MGKIVAGIGNNLKRNYWDNGDGTFAEMVQLNNAVQGVTPTTVTASGVVSAVPVLLWGYYVSASASGVCTLYDNASAGSGAAYLLSGKTVAANDLVMLPVPITLQNGLYFALGSGTATVRLFTTPILT